MTYARVTPDGDTIVSVKIIPNAVKTEIVGVVGDMLKIRVQAPPEKGKANKELIEFLATRFGISKTQCEIVRGHASSHKLVRFRGVDVASVNLV